MCDTVVVVTPAAVWLAKNSDREPGEAQLVEHCPPTKRGGSVRCTHIEIPDVDATYAVTLSRPFWMWGAEMGVNEKGVAIGNEAVFTTEKLDVTGLTGMDMLRLALERCDTARSAVDEIARLLAQHGQGGRMGYRDTGFSYASSFLVADAREAWVLETAGRRFAAERVTAGVRSISNALTIEKAALVDEKTAREAGRSDVDFRTAFDRGVMSALAGASRRRACTAGLAAASFDAMARALRDHAGHAPSDGLVMSMPCAHAALWPTRTAGQTTGSMIARLTSTSSRAWMTGTSSPCLSVFKPVPVTSSFAQSTSHAPSNVARPFEAGTAPGAGYDAESLWWRHERLHRAALAHWPAATPVIDAARALEAKLVDADPNHAWAAHRAVVDEWRASIPAARSRWYWRRQSALDRVPAS